MCLHADCALNRHVVVAAAVGCKVPADLRLTQVLSSVIRVDQVRLAPYMGASV